MKSILYFGAFLMIGASIYGFVDYRKTSRTKEFKQLYAEPDEPIDNPALDEEKVMADPIAPTTEKEIANKTSTVEKKTTPKKRKFKKKKTEEVVFKLTQFSRARPRKLVKEEPVLEVVVPDKLESTNQ